MDRRRLMISGGLVVGAALWLGWIPTPGGAAENLTSRHLTTAELQGDPGILIVDIRSPGEWHDTGVIQGALLVTYSDAESFLRQVAPQLAPGQKLALICRSGNRTSRAARQIAPLTSHDVINVSGGMLHVMEQGHSTVPPTVPQKTGAP